MIDINDLIQAYTKQPVGNEKPQDFCCSYLLWNSVCGDDIEVFLNLDDAGNIIDFGYLGHPSMFTITAASLLTEDLIARKKTSYQELMSWDLEYMKHLGFHVSPRRQRSAVAPLLACRNAIHKWLDDDIVETFDDLVK
jgi:NifU-like protein involved in Fe-S cluster formation